MENLCVFPIIAGAETRSATSPRHQCASFAAEFHRNSGKPNPNPPEARGLAYSAVAWGAGGRPQEPSIRGASSSIGRSRGEGDRANSPGTAAAAAPRRNTSRRRRREISRPSAGTGAGAAVRGANPWGPFLLLERRRAARERRRRGGGEARRLETMGFSLLRLSLSSRGFSLFAASLLRRSRAFGAFVRLESRRRGPPVSGGGGDVPVTGLWAPPGCRPRRAGSATRRA